MVEHEWHQVKACASSIVQAYTKSTTIEPLLAKAYERGVPTKPGAVITMVIVNSEILLQTGSILWREVERHK